VCQCGELCQNAHVCGHLLCELIGDGACSLATNRSRGCRPQLAAREVAPEMFAEVRELVAVIERRRDAAVRLAQIIRREALDDRNLVVLARDEDPELAAALARLCVRQR